MSTIKPFFLDLTQSEIDNITSTFGDILSSGQLILGKYTKQFEDEFASYIGTKYAVSMNSGTSALEALLIHHKAKGKKVAVPTNTNFASVAAIIHTGGVPVYMDMTKEHFVPDLKILKTIVERYDIDGVMWVHIGGIISPDFIEVVEYCKSKGIFLIEDAAHAHGSSMGGIKAGAYADGAAFSFFPTKVMTTMEGGMITTNDKALADLAKSLRNQGKRDGDFGGLHYDLGNSWRISEIAAYMGLVQLAKLDDMIERRSVAANSIASTLDSIGVNYCSTSHMEQASNYKFIIQFESKKKAGAIRESLKEMGIFCGGGVYEMPCHQHPVFSDISYTADGVKVSEEWCGRHICPPITSGTTSEDILFMQAALRELLG
jgi:perosamine synthetase